MWLDFQNRLTQLRTDLNAAISDILVRHAEKTEHRIVVLRPTELGQDEYDETMLNGVCPDGLLLDTGAGAFEEPRPLDCCSLETLLIVLKALCSLGYEFENEDRAAYEGDEDAEENIERLEEEYAA